MSYFFFFFFQCTNAVVSDVVVRSIPQIVQCMDVLQKRYYSEINVDVLEYEIFSHLLENK